VHRPQVPSPQTQSQRRILAERELHWGRFVSDLLGVSPDANAPAVNTSKADWTYLTKKRGEDG